MENALQERALGHLIRMSNSDSTITLLMRIAERAKLKLEAKLGTLSDMAGTAGPLASLHALHREPHPLRVNLRIPGMPTKNTAAVTARQLTEDHFCIQYDGWTRVYTDVSIHRSGSTQQ